MTIKNFLVKYHKQLDHLDLGLIIANIIKKPREFVLAHPEYEISKFKIKNLKLKISRRMRDEPLAYILGHKGFFGLDFAVNKHTLIPRPETELLVEKVLELKPKNKTIIDIGSGSGNIIISLSKNIEDKNALYATDISKEALKIAKQNATIHAVNKKITFLQGSLLEPLFENLKFEIGNSKMIILANLPYLSKKIYAATALNVKKYEPKSALYSAKAGLDHYEKLLKQIIIIHNTSYFIHYTVFLEISPEQKPKLTKLIKSFLPTAKIEFYRDSAKKWRICKISLN